ARQPPHGQARRGQPHRGGRPRPGTRPDRLGRLRVEEDAMLVTEYDVGPGAYGVAVAADGAVWTSLTGRGELARVGPDGQVSRIPLDTGQSRPMVLARGPDDAIWFSRGDGRIGRISLDGGSEEFPLPAGSMPSLITAGPDGALWCTLNQASAIGRITPAG